MFDTSPAGWYLHPRIMPFLRHRAGRLVGGLFIVALLVASLVASAHTHRDLATPRSCATCLAAHHAPAVVMPAIAAQAVILAATAPPPSAHVAPARLHRSPRAGRAPPSPTPASVA
jgi:hypothetical protein